MQHPIAQTRNGKAVYVDLIKSEAATNIGRQPYLLGLIKELIVKSAVKGAMYRVEHDMGRKVGHAYVVKTTEKDVIVYARRLHDPTFTRFVKNGTPHPTQYLSIVLRRDNDGSYELENAWVGRQNPPRPGGEDETEDSKLYWTEHAFVFNDEPIQLRTLTKVCPY